MTGAFEFGGSAVLGAALGVSRWQLPGGLRLDPDSVTRFLSLADANTRWVVMGSLLLGLASGVLGAFALLRRQALLGDALAHAALPGVCIAFWLTGSKDPLVLLIGALITGKIGTLSVAGITRYTRIKEDSAIAIVLSVFFGVGIGLLTMILRMPGGNQSGLDRYLFGQAASLLPEDLRIMVGLTGGIGVVTFLLFKELKLITFDPQFAATIGFPVRGLGFLLTAMIVLAVVIGLQAVGVVLMAAMLITPAAAARQWTESLGVMVILAGVFGALAGVLGAFVSALDLSTVSGPVRLPTGPLTVVAATFVFVVSLIFAPGRGVLARWRRHRSNRLRVLRENVLKTLFQLDEAARSEGGGRRTVEQVAERRGIAARPVRTEFRRLLRSGLVEGGPGGVSLSGVGRREARRVVRNHRLWESYLVHAADIARDHVHRDAEAVEHLLPPELVEAIEASLPSADVDPHGMPIPGDVEADA